MQIASCRRVKTSVGRPRVSTSFASTLMARTFSARMAATESRRASLAL